MITATEKWNECQRDLKARVEQLQRLASSLSEDISTWGDITPSDVNVLQDVVTNIAGTTRAMGALDGLKLQEERAHDDEAKEVPGE